MDHLYRFEYANVHRGLHYLSNTATQRFEEAREIVRRFLNAGSVDEIIFTKNATAAINLVADSFGWLAIGEGDEIVLSIMEHHSNIVPWHFHRERNGAVLKWAPIADSGELLLEEFERLLTPRTKIVAITHMSNVLGTLVPVQRGHPPGARPRHPGAGRRQPVGGAPAPSTCAISTPTSTCSPATRRTARPASACCTPRRRTSTPCPPTRAAAT